MIGQTISHYIILEKLGEGGMGIVYKARDTTLDRTVALKFLPPHLRSSEQDKARFIQEAKAASAINHPNICTIYSIEEHEEQMFIVMELVEGQTLRQKRESISYKQAIDIGIQIADGLAAAHEKGIVHRDLKPENIMIRKDGIAQIMDFGLAKLRNASSKISRLTKEGSTVGTAGYMSPEQIQGADIDHRSDIFSYGILLYELLTGQLPFKGVHDTALAYEIVNVDAPPMSSVNPGIDPSLDAIVLECLEKEVNERAQSMMQISVDLKRFKRESSRQRASRITAARPSLSASHAPMPPAAPAGAARVPRLPWIVAATAVVAAMILGFLQFPAREAPRVLVQTSILPSQNAVVSPIGSLALSPDGSTLAYVASDSGGASRLWLRPLKSTAAYPLGGTEAAYFPFWSPDNKFIGFFSRGALKKVEAGTGSVTTICNADVPSGGSWNADGTIIYTSLTQAGIFRVPAQGGAPVMFAAGDSSHEDIAYSAPCFLPDGRHFLFSVNNRLMVVTTERERGGVFIGSLDSDEPRKILGVSSNVLTADGYLLYIRNNHLVAQQFDPARGELSGEPATVAEGVQFEDRYGMGDFSVSQNGMLVYQGEVPQGSGALVMYGRHGGVLQKVGPDGLYDDPVLSPDGSKLAYTLYGSPGQKGDIRGDVWIADLVRGGFSRLTYSPNEEDDPVWTPDGMNIIYSDVGEIVIKPASGIGDKRVLYSSRSDKVPTDISSDGKYLLFCDYGAKTGRDIWALPMTDHPTPIPVAVSQFAELSAHFSPDGKWIAYASNETGRLEVYIRSFPSPTGKWQISTEGGSLPQWDATGSTVYFLDPKGRMMAVGITAAGTSIHAGTPAFLFETKNATNGNSPGHIYDVSSDGRKFIVSEERWREDRSEPLNLIVNWSSGLKKK